MMEDRYLDTYAEEHSHGGNEDETNTISTRVFNPITEHALSTALEQDDGGKAKGSARPLVRITRRSRRMLDRDNLWASAKIIIDQLRATAIITDDDEESIRLEVEQTKVKSKAEIGTYVEIEYID
jgi:hypothetical protein